MSWVDKITSSNTGTLPPTRPVLPPCKIKLMKLREPNDIKSKKPQNKTENETTNRVCGRWSRVPTLTADEVRTKHSLQCSVNSVKINSALWKRLSRVEFCPLHYIAKAIQKTSNPRKKSFAWWRDDARMRRRGPFSCWARRKTRRQIVVQSA